jgi:hypothetical protein
MRVFFILPFLSAMTLYAPSLSLCFPPTQVLKAALDAMLLQKMHSILPRPSWGGEQE